MHTDNKPSSAASRLSLSRYPPPAYSSSSSDFSSDSDAPTYLTRASHFTARSLLKPEYVPAVPLPSSPSTDDSDGEGDEKGGVDTAAVRNVSPLDSLRRGNTMMQLIGAGALSLGSTLVISLYVTGPPRLNDMATASTAVLFMTLLLGCLACVPSWFAALLILCGEKPQPLEPPPHGKVLRLATLIAFFVATLYSVATLVLFVLLQAKDSFVSFCMQNIPSATDEACKARWDRDWVIILVVGIVWIYHIALGFPVYRYTRGTEYGRQLKSGFLLEEGKPQRSSLQRRLSQWADSSSDSDFLPPKRAARRELDTGKAARSEKRTRREAEPNTRSLSMGDLPLNSGDLNKRGGTLSSRRSALSLRNSPRINVPGPADGASTSPTSPAFYSPNSQLGAPPSPFLDSQNVNHFSTLPPSPPLVASAGGPAVPPLRSLTPAVYPTPPSSAPSSARARAGFQTAVDMGDSHSPFANQAPRSSSVLLGEDLNADPSGKRRPSLILTSAPTEEPQGLAIGIDMGGPYPSPFLQRSFSGSTSPLNSPTIPSSPYFSTSPVSSPTIGSFHSPRLASGSPTLGSSATMERAPSSPRLSTLTDPLGRLATGLVRRASNSGLNTDLPTSIKRADSSPTLSPSLSPILGAGPARRTSFAAAAREKEKEKEKEIQERQAKQRAATFHNRMFSWADRPGDRLAARKPQTGAKAGSKKRAITLGVLVLVVALFFTYRTFAGSRSQKDLAASPPLTERANRAAAAQLGPRLRRTRGNGKAFIHPDVVQRKPAPSKSWIGAPFRLAGRLLGAGKAQLPSGYRAPQVSRRKGGKDGAAGNGSREAKRRSVFVAKKHVAFVDHQALPPPVEHGDEPQRDTLVLYRILGNDLPPRHSPGQTLRNLRFLLQHESDFSVLPPLGPHGVHHSHLYGSGTKAKEAHTQMGGLRVDKYFVLNRIAEPEMVSAIIGLLHLYSVPDSRILVIPFDWSEYQRREFRWDGGVDSATGWTVGDGPHLKPSFGKAVWRLAPEGQASKTPDDLSVLLEEADGEEARTAAAKKKKSETLGRLRALDFTYHEKNLYAMNNNGGRNFALQHGRSLPNARWILPLDGNSFFTPAAMYSIVRTLSIAGEGPAASRYVIIPMARLLDNNEVRKNNSVSLVPLDRVEEGVSAIIESEIHHRPQHAPETPEEPQVGFRYDSTETFQEAMRYGRRSKLELLWRLGAIPYSRGLDRRTLPWEVTDRAHITANTWGSIPGVDGAATKDSVIHAPHGEEDEYGEANPERGALAYVKAGWVYRLFSGHKSQEEHSSEAVTLRNTNRIRGIVAFLERLDEKVARGEHGCFEEENTFRCGFHAERFWSFDQHDVERLRQKYKLGRRDAIQKIDRYEQLIAPTTREVAKALKNPRMLADTSAQRAATNAALLAMAAYLTGNTTYTSFAADLIGERFVKKTPLFYRQVAQNDQIRTTDGEEGEQPLVDDGKDVVGYAFPPFPKEPGQPGPWSASLGMRLAEPDSPSLPFDPLNFDPILLLDAVRLLNHPNTVGGDFVKPASRKAFTPLANSHLSWLLFAPEALEFSKQPPSAEDGAFYDAKVAALAAFLDDARLVGRVANRARLRLPSSTRAEGLMDPAREVHEVHYRLLQGLTNTKIRPYNLVATDKSLFTGSAHGNETPLDVLGL
ncbi:hypothetical protein JCM10213_008793 [Rhodosporidiobolus nylandii]